MLCEVLKYQSAYGGFPSYVQAGAEIIADENCFITSLVLLELIHIASDTADERLQEAINRGIGFIENCQEPGSKGRFCFYPYAGSSPRFDIRLDADCDDSALALLVLLKAGKRTPAEIKELVATQLEPHRMTFVADHERGWVGRPLFRTWMNGTIRDNPIDCCVNLNVLALYHEAGFGNEEITSATVNLIINAVNLYGTKDSALRLIAPYYAHRAELYFATQRTVKAGVPNTEPLLQQLTKQLSADKDDPFSENRPICCNAHGRPLWFSPALQKIRKINYLSSLH
ncbi:hypothetical protein [Mucilaginibacter paludis]|uniref:Uncharacterized protein n=1 Tax=Mucilaginibacter paludis DSM 18603 TaxID=714943 RepID=H1YA13_9SPHI|nr:hypothetical protein [Mucilaginibacter paludis]EHQ24997.1 hypothetical protein Mucpa_0816 [Mucilaginibacter paludis DSM 18603]